jgi:3-polyprenyl-4-hydroxybenzoate decarboxylase
MGPIDVLDHSSRAFTYGSKMGIDATRKLPEEGFTRDWPALIEMDDATKARVDAMWGKLGIGARSEARGVSETAQPLPVDETAARVAGR